MGYNVVSQLRQFIPDCFDDYVIAVRHVMQTTYHPIHQDTFMAQPIAI